MKFIIYSDYRADYKPMSVDYTEINAKTLEEAITVADQMWDAKKHYLMRIMKKTGKVITPYKAGYKFEEYTAILTRRSHGWHINNEENCEQEHKVNKNWLTANKNEVWYEVIN